MSAQFGIRRRVELSNHRFYMRTEELLCPCCGHLTRIEFDQDNGLPNGHTTVTHCLNERCEGFYMTRKVESFFEIYGKTKLEEE